MLEDLKKLQAGKKKKDGLVLFTAVLSLFPFNVKLMLKVPV